MCIEIDEVVEIIRKSWSLFLGGAHQADDAKLEFTFRGQQEHIHYSSQPQASRQNYGFPRHIKMEASDTSALRQAVSAKLADVPGITVSGPAFKGKDGMAKLNVLASDPRDRQRKFDFHVDLKTGT